MLGGTRGSPRHTQGTVCFPLISALCAFPSSNTACSGCLGRSSLCRGRLGSKHKEQDVGGTGDPEHCWGLGSGDDVRFSISATPFLIAKIAFFLPFCDTIFNCKKCFFSSLKYMSSPEWQREGGFSVGGSTHPSHSGFSRSPQHTQGTAGSSWAHLQPCCPSPFTLRKSHGLQHPKKTPLKG